MTFVVLMTALLSIVGALFGWGIALVRRATGPLASGFVILSVVTTIFLPLLAHFADVPGAVMPVNDISRETVAAFLRPFQAVTGPLLFTCLLLTVVAACRLPLLASALPLASFVLYFKVCLPLINRGRSAEEFLMLDNVPVIWVFMFSFSGSILLLACALVLRFLKRPATVAG